NTGCGLSRQTAPHHSVQTPPQATTALRHAAFNPNPTYVHSDAPQGQVIHQNPAPGTARPEGSSVAIEISNGPPQVSVPPVVGETTQQAVTDLEAAGFQVNQQPVSVSDASQDGIVQAQNTDGGGHVTRGSTVRRTVG